MDGAENIRQTLIAQLKTRFDHVINFDSAKFDSKYVVSTVVDPSLAYMLYEPESKLLSLAKDMVCHLIFNL